MRLARGGIPGHFRIDPSLALLAWAIDSRMSAPAPSPMTNPSRPRSKGREAFPGHRYTSSRAPEASKIRRRPGSDAGIGADHDHGVCRAARMACMACPRAWALEEQAVEIVRFGPFAP